MIQVTLLTRPDCCLCETAKMILGRLRTRYTFEVRELSIADDAESSNQYGEAIPVIFVDGEEACRGRVEERRIKQLLEKKAPLGVH